MDDPHAELEIKPQLKPRGRVTKEEDTKPSHQLYKWPIKSTRSTRQTLSMLLLLLSCFSLTLCDPIDGSTLGNPSLGFSRQEHWSGLPFPSPMDESEK